MGKKIRKSITCSKCGGNYPAYVRMKLRKTGKRTKSTASYCVLCQREDQKIIEARRYDKKLEYNRAWRKRNREKVNGYTRKHHAKKQRERQGEGLISYAPLASLRYVPMYPGGKY